jgi:hypothetical protein
MPRKPKATSHTQQIEALVRTTWELEPGPAKVAVLEEAVRLADAHADVPQGFRLREMLIDAATFGGSPEVALVAFAWCLAAYDRDPAGGFNLFGLLWKYKWVLDAAVEYPTVGRGQIREMLADMERRYRAAGAGLHPVHQTAREVYRFMGDMPAAKAAHALVRQSPRDALSNCRACEEHAQVKYYLGVGKPAQAVKKAEPLVAGRMTCAQVPHVTYSYLLLPVLFAGDPATAAEYHRRGVRLLGTNPKFVSNRAWHLIFLAVTDNLTAAARYLEKQLGTGLATTCPAWRFDFAAAAAFVLDRLIARPRQLRVRVPAGAALPADVDPTDLTALRDHFRGDAQELAAAFDARNGNDHFARQLAALDALHQRVTPYPL